MKHRRYGVDVAAYRVDDLDRALLEMVAAMTHPHILELGCGSGGLATRLRAAGAHVTAIDIEAQDEWEQTNPDSELIRYIAGDVRVLPTLIANAVYDAVVAQRVLHYLTHEETSTLLDSLRHYTTKLFASVSGLESAIGEHYPHRTAPLPERYATLPAAAAETFYIYEPICLYTQAELVDTVLRAGWEVERVWTSAFGNHKLIAQRV